MGGKEEKPLPPPPQKTVKGSKNNQSSLFL